MRKRLIDQVSIEELKAMYESGMSYRDIGESLGVSCQTIRTHLKDIVTPHGRGGYIAKGISKEIIAPKAHAATMHQIEEKNSANACLVVEDRTIKLSGTTGRYEINALHKRVTCELRDGLFELGLDEIPEFVEELKAIGRNIAQVSVGCEMW